MKKLFARLSPLALGPVLALLAGCGAGFHGAYNLPLPGGAALGGHPYRVTAEFTDALDLVPQSAVRVDNIAVGRVSRITLSPDGRLAEVTLELNGDVHLPANAVARIEQTSLLGEKYVALSAPSNAAATGTLADGSRISDDATSQGVQLEQVFGALSLLLNGGGLTQLHEITTELNKASSGNEAAIRSVLSSASQVIGQLDAHRGSITQALDELNQLSGTLAADNGKISNVLANFSPGLKVITDQRQQLVGMLQALDRLSQVTVRTVSASQDDLVADLRQLQPILQNLADAGTALPQSLQVLLTYPFPDAALGSIKGDYLNVFVTENLRTPGGTMVTQQPWPAVPTGPKSAGRSRASVPTTIGPPPALLPSTSSVAPGLTSSALVSAPPSASASPSGSASGSSVSSSPSSGSSPSGSGSLSSSSSPSGGGSASAGSSPTGGGR